MKKSFKVVTLLLALALTACGSSTPASNASSGKAGSSQTPQHTHVAAENATWQSDDDNHWKDCKDNDGGKVEKGAHQWVEDTTKQGVPATCSTVGKKYEKCSVCGKERVVDLPKTDHEWEKQKDNEKETGYTQTAQYKCKHGDHYALRWTALDYTDSVDIEENNASSSNPNSVRLKTAQYDQQNREKIGSKLVYKFKSGAAVQNAGFAFNAVLKYGSGAPAPLFDYVSGDQQQGYIENEKGELVLTTKRYQLKVNDKIIEIGKDEKYGDEITGEAGKPAWYDWPVSFDLKAGDNTLEILCLGGYRAYLYDFQVTGLPQNA